MTCRVEGNAIKRRIGHIRPRTLWKRVRTRQRARVEILDANGSVDPEVRIVDGVFGHEGRDD